LVNFFVIFIGHKKHLETSATSSSAEYTEN